MKTGRARVCGFASLCAAICATLLLAFSPAGAAAPLYLWRNVTVGGGGFSPAIIFSPAEQGLAYLRTDIGGAYRWDARARVWIPLQDAMAQGNYFGVESLAPDPVDANTVYLAAGMYRGDDAAILRSNDRGASWRTFPIPFRMGGNEGGRGLGERLAIDPNDPALLYFGSRYDGLQRSDDRGAHWSRVESFPLSPHAPPPRGEPASAGIAFVLFDAAGAAPGAPSRMLIAGVADAGAHHLFRSDDAGVTWRVIADEPRAELLPVQAGINAAGMVYIAYSNGVGPNGVGDGAVYKYNTRSGAWTEITPDKGARGEGGYMGLSLDRQAPGTLVVASVDRWSPHDTIWRSTNGGATWRDFHDVSRRDVSASPFLLWGETEANFGWWIAGLAIDPFDGNRIAYTTGATLYLTDQARAGTIAWRPWVAGVEETAVLTLASPPAGPPLLSGFGDIGGFAHTDLARSPPMFSSPVFTNTNTIDYAGAAPNVMIRSGTPYHGGATLAFSLDSGATWAPLHPPGLRGTNAQGVVETRHYDTTGDTAIIVSADGASFMFLSPVPLITRNRGQSWSVVRGLPPFARPVADRVDPNLFYALDFQHGTFWTSRDGGATFTQTPSAGLPGDISGDEPRWREQAFPLIAAPGHAGELWYLSHAVLYHSIDGGARFAAVHSDTGVDMLGFGKPAPGRERPTLFAAGWRGQVRAIWRSDDDGASWIRINDDAHEYGRRFRCIAGDPRVYGRVYVGTDGRGILYGEPAS